jgi:hypothetical protein
MPGFWKARWLVPGGAEDVGVFVFRRSLLLEEAPASLVLNVSADERYRLFVNGHEVSQGPPRGDLQHWFFREVEIAPRLRAGENTVHAVVWRMGSGAPYAQLGSRTAFICEGGPCTTPEGWEFARVPDAGFTLDRTGNPWEYAVVGPGETGRGHDWETAAARADLDWRPAPSLHAGKEPGSGGGDSPWWLMPAAIPEMRSDLREDPIQICDTETGERRPFQLPLRVEKGRPLILDLGRYDCYYPRFELQGEGAARFTYCEALFDADGQKGHRDDVKGRRALGQRDRLELNKTGSFEPLWWRAGRYIQVEADDAPVTLTGLRLRRTGYPLEVSASFRCSDPDLNALWELCLHTLRMGMGENYFDSPYYEQLQYAGDTRIVAQLTRMVSGDQRLPRLASRHFAMSRTARGIVQSRYPNRELQIIPGYALFWGLMIYDQWLYDPQPPLAEDVRTALDQCRLYREHVVGEGMEYWSYGDWVDDWPWGVPPGGARATMHWLTLLLTEACLAKMTGDTALLAKVKAEAATLPEGWARHPQDPDPKPCAQSEALQRILDWELRFDGPAPPPLEAAPWPADPGFPASFYFAHYEHLARPGDDYCDLIGPWRQMLQRGFTATPEKAEPTRSDCHAWSAHPALHMLQRIAGISSAAPGFAQAFIHPRPGGLEWFEAAVPHPAGTIRVAWRDGKLSVDCPVEVVGLRGESQ